MRNRYLGIDSPDSAFVMIPLSEYSSKRSVI